MGCIFSSDAVGDGGPVLSGEAYVYVPGLRDPTPIDFPALLKGAVSTAMATRLQSLREQVIAASRGRAELELEPKPRTAQDGDLDAEKALRAYLPVLLGLVTGGEKFTAAVEYSWTNVGDERGETALASGYYELLSVLHLMGIRALHEANICLTPRPPADGLHSPKASEGMCLAFHPVFAFGRFISASLSWHKLSDENKRHAIEVLLKAASYFGCAITAVLPHTPDEIKAKLPADLAEGMLRSLEQQALGQAVELQLWFAIDNVKASLAVKRRLACEQVEVWEQALEKLASAPSATTITNKHILYVKWKLAEAKAAAYYFHGLILNEGYDANAHAESLSCLKAAHAHLKECQKARTEFSNMEPGPRAPSLWGPMKYLAERIPRETLSKGRVFRENHFMERFPATTPKLPEFPIALEAGPCQLPPVDPAWKKEQGFEARPSLTPDVPSFLPKRNQSPTRSPFPDLRRALAPPTILPDMVVEAR